MARTRPCPPDEFLWTVAVARIVLGADDAPAGAAEPLRPRRARRAASRPGSTTGAASRPSPRPRQPRAAVARARRAARRDRATRARRSRRGSPCTRSTCATPSGGSTPTCASRCSRVSDMDALARDDDWAAGSRRVAPPTLLPGVPAVDAAARGRSARCSTACSPARRSVSTRSSRCSRRAGPTSWQVAAVADQLRRDDRRRRRHLRAHAQHQLHEHLHVQVPVLRVLEGPAVAQPARHALPARRRGDPTPGRRSGRVRRHRGVPPGRDPPRLRRRLLPVRRARGEGGRADDPPARVHRARGHRGRAPARHAAPRRTSSLAKDAGLASLPGTAAEILDDEVRAVICPDKVNTEEWLEAHRIAHSVGLRSNVTIMFGTVERPVHVARHLVRTRDAAEGDGRLHRVRAAAVRAHGEPDLPPADAPGAARRCARSLLMHAVGRIAYRGWIDNVQVSWVKAGVARRAPGAPRRVQRPRRHAHGREHLARRPARATARSSTTTTSARIVEPLGRPLEQRTTLYGRTHHRRAPAAARCPDAASRPGRSAPTPSSDHARRPRHDPRRRRRSARGRELVSTHRRRRHRQRPRRRAQPRGRRVRRRARPREGRDDAHRHRARRDALRARWGPSTEISGGSAANTMVGIASFGGSAAFIGRVERRPARRGVRPRHPRRRRRVHHAARRPAATRPGGA